MEEKKVDVDVDVKKEVSKHETLGRWNNVSVTKWYNTSGVCYTVQIGYKKYGSWFNKNLGVFPDDVPNLVTAVLAINDDLVKA